ILKEAADLESSALSCRAVTAYFDAGHFPGHLELIRHEYGMRRDRMMEALARHLPEGTRWTRPAGGFFTWAELPEGFDTMPLLDRAGAEGQGGVVPGPGFGGAEGARTRGMR